MTLRAWVLVLLSAAAVQAAAAENSEVERGRDAIVKYSCGVCHQIEGIATPGGNIGPSLKDVARRAYLAGSIPNRRDNMARWIQHPQELRPGTAMPDMGVDAGEARAITAYLYAQR